MANPPDESGSASETDRPGAGQEGVRPGGRRVAERAGRVPLRRRPAWAWLRLLRPVAGLSLAGVGVSFAFILAEGAPVWDEALRVGVALFAVVAAASAMNDGVDRWHDRDAHIWRPLAADLMAPRNAALLAGAFAVSAVVIGASLGGRALLPLLGGLACAGVYNLQLRSTPFSWLPLSIGFALVPPFVAEAVGAFDNYLWWSLPVGALGGLAAHLAMKLPDYERDDVVGAQGVMHWMTIDYAVPMSWGLMSAYLVVAVVSANIERLRIEWVVPSASVGIVVTLAMMTWSVFGVTERKLVWQRWLFSLAIAGMAIGWLGSIVP